MTGLDPVIHAPQRHCAKAWMPGTSPGMTVSRDEIWGRAAYAAMPMLFASSAALRMLADMSLATALCSSTAAAVEVT